MADRVPCLITVPGAWWEKAEASTTVSTKQRTSTATRRLHATSFAGATATTAATKSSTVTAYEDSTTPAPPVEMILQSQFGAPALFVDFPFPGQGASSIRTLALTNPTAQPVTVELHRPLKLVRSCSL